jgi:hypothetical protein
LHKYHLPSLDKPELVIIAGLSGSGKSAFLKQIKSDLLPEGVVLPDGVQDWPVVGSSRPDYPPGAPGFILHYDMNGRGLWDGAEYRDDPALVFVPWASALTVINLRPSPSQLTRQLTERENTKIAKRKREQSRLIWRLSILAIKVADRILPRHLTKAIRRRTPFRKTPEGLQKKLRLYEQPGWLEDIYARWAVYLDSVAQTGKPVRQIFIEPDEESFRWRLTSL